MKTKSALQRMILIKAFADALNEFVAAERGDVLETLLEKYREEGSKSFSITLPTGGKVASITLPEPKATDKTVDEAALYEWAAGQNAPMTTETIPAVKRRIVRRISAKWLDDKIKNAIEGDDGDLVDVDSGEVIPGIKRVPGGDPKSFTIRFEKDGREKVATAYRRGELDELVEGTALPALGTGE